MRGIGFISFHKDIWILQVEDQSATPEDQVIPEKTGQHLVKGKSVGADFVTNVFPCLLELIATVKGESVSAFCDRRYAIKDLLGKQCHTTLAD